MSENPGKKHCRNLGQDQNGHRATPMIFSEPLSFAMIMVVLARGIKVISSWC